MLSISLENANCETFTAFLEDVLLEEKKIPRDHKYTLVKSNAGEICYVNCASVCNCTPLSEREFTVVWWNIYRKVSFLEHTIKAKIALQRIRELEIIHFSAFSYILDTFVYVAGLSQCYNHFSMSSNLCLLDEKIKNAFEELELQKKKLIESYNEEMKNFVKDFQPLQSHLSYKTTLSCGKKALLKLHPDRNPNNLAASTEISVRFLDRYTKLQDLLVKIYGITAERLDELLYTRA